MARFVTYSQTGGPEVLTIAEGPEPTPGPGQLVVEIKAAGVNPIDWKLRSGLRGSGPFTAPRGTGSDGAGVISAVGAGVEGWSTGDAVVVANTPGTYATHVVADAENLTAKPESVGFDVAAALGIPVSTAHQALGSLKVGAGDRLLVHGGSGSVGQAAIQLAVAAGATVVATAGEANLATVRDLGATAVTYGPGLVDRLREASPDGFTAALDCAGTDEALDASLALAPRERIGTIVVGAKYHELGLQAWAGGSPEPLTAEQIALRGEAVSTVLPLIESGAFKVQIALELPLDQAAEAQRRSQAGTVHGKIVLIP